MIIDQTNKSNEDNFTWELGSIVLLDFYAEYNI